MEKTKVLSQFLPIQSWRTVKGMIKMASFKEDTSNTNAMNNIGDKTSFMHKKNAFSLGKFKVVYSRDEDEADTIIIRNLYAEAKENQSLFGMKGVDNVKRLFLSLVSICHDNKKWIKKGAQFLDNADLVQVTDVYLENNLYLKKLKNFIIDASYYVQFALGDDGSGGIVKVEFNRERMVFSLSFYIAEGIFRSRIYLFTNEVMKLMRYLNSRFEFSEIQTLKLMSTDKEMKAAEVIDFSKDNFF